MSAGGPDSLPAEAAAAAAPAADVVAPRAASLRQRTGLEVLLAPPDHRRRGGLTDQEQRVLMGAFHEHPVDTGWKFVVRDYLCLIAHGAFFF